MNVDDMINAGVCKAADIPRRDSQYLEGEFQGLSIHSAYQPIYSFAHQLPVGYEALMRATDRDGSSISPLEIFSNIKEQEALMHLEELTRTLHAINYFRNDTTGAWLFLNVNPAMVNNCGDCMYNFFSTLDENGIPPSRIVIEFVEASVKEFGNLVKVTRKLKQNGCRVAIDDFGAGFSNFNRIWDLEPDIVKLDKSMLDRLRTDPGKFRPFISLVELLHESGSLVVMEGIESEADAGFAHDLDIDLHQGYYFGRPERELQAVWSRLNPYLQIKHGAHDDKSTLLITEDLPSGVEMLFRESTSGAHPDMQIERTCEPLLNHPRVMSCYLLDNDGYQLGSNIYGEHAKRNVSTPFEQLGDDEAANWGRRKYFRRAMENPREMQITKPYRSLTGLGMCKTISVALNDGEKSFVLCCDIGI
ncbi:EAL domain-containing protein [Thiohalophilus sp.]|uniref:EAL domain-containing protein n=1 Tax=Thiohalophilus sp. TaxID=3028392 RepID=UPI00397540B4